MPRELSKIDVATPEQTAAISSVRITFSIRPNPLPPYFTGISVFIKPAVNAFCSKKRGISSFSS
jgi:hypothetical protein